MITDSRWSMSISTLSFCLMGLSRFMWIIWDGNHVAKGSCGIAVLPQVKLASGLTSSVAQALTMAELIAGGAVGVACAELFTAVKKASKDVWMFRERLISIESALNTLTPIVKEIETLNNSLGISNEELKEIHDLLKDGKVLVEKCVKIKWHLWNKHKYSGRLLELDNKILKFCQIKMVSIGARNSTAGRASVNELHSKVDRLSVMWVDNKSGAEKDVGRSKIPQFKSCCVPEGPDFVVGLDVSLEKIKDELLNGVEPVFIISAAGGYGKTTLVKKLCYDKDVAGKYKDNIIFIAVSESPNLMKIVQNIVHHLTGTEADLQSHSEDDAIQYLQQLLAEKAKQNPILLILDDIWSSSKSILEKFLFKKIKNYKVVVTSRFEFPEIGSSHKLKGLGYEDAVMLLSHAATPLAGSYILPDEEIVDQVVERCKGSPLALTVVGKSLCGKHKSAWQSKLNEWSGGVSLIDVDGANSEILRCLMNSLKDLDRSDELRRIKQFFLDLGSFPEDHRIGVPVLIDMLSELHGLDGNGVDIVAAIYELSARSLADLTVLREDLSVGDGYYNFMFVTQHDLLRDLAILYNNQGPLEERERLNLNIRKNNLPEWFLKEQKQPLKARLVSICTDEEFSSAWPDLELPEVEVLVLNFRAKKNNYALPNFIKKMVKLKTLIITNNYGSLPAELSNFDVIASLSNLKKIRLSCVKIPYHTIAGLCLSNLKKVSAFGCNISEEIQTSEVQIHMVLPALEEIDICYCYNLKTLPKGICEAKTLKKINITYCNELSELPKEIGNLSELQVLRLNACISLRTLPCSIGCLENLSYLDISNCFSIKYLPEEFGELHQLKEFHLSGCSSLSSLPASVSQLEKVGYLIVNKEQRHFRKYFKNCPKLKLKLKEGI